MNLRLLIYGFLFGLITASTSLALPDPPFGRPSQTELNRLQSAIIYTSKGKVFVELYPEDAPWHVANLKYLSDKGIYDGARFASHYDYILEVSEIDKSKKTITPYGIPAEFNSHKHVSGTLAMARAPDLINPARSSHWYQFYILLGEAPHLDEKYTVFGRVTKGMHIIRSLGKNDSIKGIQVFVRD